MKGISHYRDAQAAGVSLSPEFVDQVLGTPRCSIEQAHYNHVAVEQDRKAVRIIEIDQALSRMEWDKAHITRAMKVLREERALLEVSTHG